MRVRIAALAMLVLAAGCKDGTGSRVGELSVNLSGAVPPRAVLLRVVGETDSISVPATGNWMVSIAPQEGDTTLVAIIAPQGATLTAGVVARLFVQDVTLSAQYSVAVIQSAGPNYALLSPSAFAVGITR